MRRLFCLILISLSIKLSMAQLVLGLSGQTNYAYLKSLESSIDAKSNSLNVGFGVVLDYYLSDRYAFSSGLEMVGLRKMNISSTTVNYKGALLNDYQLSNASVQYLFLPMTLKLNTVQIGYNTFFANFGLLAGFKTQSTGEHTYSNAIEIETDKYAQQFLLAYRIGGGVSYGLGGTTSLNIGLFYDASIGNFINLEDQKGILMRNIALKGSIMF